MQPEKLEPWLIEDEESVFSCRIFDVVRIRATLKGRNKTHNFFILENPEWVNIIPVTKDFDVVLIQQFRMGERAFTLEIPGGLSEPGEDPLTAAQRELLEETGYEGGRAIPLGMVQPNPATHNNRCHSFLQYPVQATGKLNLDENEDIRTLLVPLREIPDMIRRGEIHHSLVLNAFFYYSLLQEQLGNRSAWSELILPA